MEPLFLKPVFKERIWGGTRLRDSFRYEISSEITGECWAISAHENGPSIIENGNLAGKTVTELWETNRELFGTLQGDKFPLLTKILDANADLSVQVHPDDVYAKEHENGELGKTECWYILDCDEGAQLILGHSALTKEEFTNKINNNEWDTLLRRVPIKKGDFFYVPSGTIHALCAGTLVLETQQSSDTTYRVYDYNRCDDKGNLRELHIEKSIDVTSIPHQDAITNPITEKGEGFEKTIYVSNEFFTVYKLDVTKEVICTQDKPFLLYSVIEGSGSLHTNGNDYKLEKGKHFILPATVKEYEIVGNVSFMVSHV